MGKFRNGYIYWRKFGLLTEREKENERERVRKRERERVQGIGRERVKGAEREIESLSVKKVDTKIL